MYFPSKKDIWQFLMIWGVILSIILIYIFGSEPVGWQLVTYKSVLGYVMSGLIIGLLMWLWFRTGYKVHDGRITVRFGPFTSRVDIDGITRVDKGISPVMAPALSMNCIWQEKNA
ncbi:PH domain-containing protein [Halobacillus salinus]|uniref:PH domain-containing protein n=1 Tax=Halobacillus salinus TaxID=192814 RepID=UPI0009A803E5|nr:PH domain-containing protein [Halobacillus salinus]